jgi:hypothetical protein
MFYKLFIEDGDYQDIDTKDPRNIMEVEIAYTPEGINVGWDEFNSIEEAMTHYNIELKPVETEE